MRLVSGCLASTPVEDLPVVSGIIPPDIRRDHLVLSVANKATEKNHMLHSTIIQHPNRRLRLKFRKPLWIHIQNLRSTDNSDSNNWSQRQRAGRWQSANSSLKDFIDVPTVDLLATGCLVRCGRGSIEFVPAAGDSNTTCSRWVFVLLLPASVVLLRRPLTISAPCVLLTGLPTISQVKVLSAFCHTNDRIALRAVYH